MSIVIDHRAKTTNYSFLPNDWLIKAVGHLHTAHILVYTCIFRADLRWKSDTPSGFSTDVTTYVETFTADHT